MATDAVFLAWEENSMAGYRPWGHRELDRTERLNMHHTVELLADMYD